VQYKNIFGDKFQWNQVSCQHFFRSGGRMHLPLRPRLYTNPNYTDRSQVNIHCIENFFTVNDCWATCACPEKTELPWKFSLYWIYFLHSGFLTTRGCPENRVSLKFFTVLNILFTISDFWAACACPEKQRVPWNFSAYWNIFYHLGFLSN